MREDWKTSADKVNGSSYPRKIVGGREHGRGGGIADDGRF